MESFFLEIISTTKVTAVTDLEWLEIVSPSGSFVIMRGHAPVLSLVASGASVSYKKNVADSPAVSLQIDGSAIFSFANGHAKVLIC